MGLTWRDLVWAGRRLRGVRSLVACGVCSLAFACALGGIVVRLTAHLEASLVPFDTPEQLIGISKENVNHEQVALWQAAASDVVTLGAARVAEYTLEVDSVPWRVHVAAVTPSWLRVLRIAPTAGRLLDEADARDGAAPLALVTASAAARLLGPSPVGRVVRLADRRGRSAWYRIVGVVPDTVRLAYLPSFDFLLPAVLGDRRDGGSVFRTIGRLAPGATLAAVTTALQAPTQAYERRIGVEYLDPMRAIPLRDVLLRDVKPPLRALGLVAALLWVVALLAALMADAMRRRHARRERAVQVALGASQHHLVGQTLLDEAICVFLALGAGGVLYASGLALIRWAAAEHLRDGALLTSTPGPYLWTATVPVALCLATSLVAGLLRRATRQAPAVHLPRMAARGYGVLAGQVALVVALLVMAGTSLLGGLRLAHMAHSIDVKNVVAAYIPFSDEYLSEFAGGRAAEQRRRFRQVLRARVAAVPGVEGVAFAASLPTTHDTLGIFMPDGWRTYVTYRGVSPEYFDVMHMRVMAGRPLRLTDDDQTMVVNEAFVKQYLPGGEAVGVRLPANGWVRTPKGPVAWSSSPHVIVGVVEDAWQGTEAIMPTAYMSIYAHERIFVWMIARARSGRIQTLGTVLQAAVRDVDPRLPVELVDVETFVQRGTATVDLVLTILWGLTLAGLAVSGLSVAFTTAQAIRDRLPEIAVRLALGGQPAAVLRTTLRRLAVACACAAIGGAIIGAQLTDRLSWLVETPPGGVGVAIAGALAICAVITLAIGAHTVRVLHRIRIAEVLGGT